jgi:hypothetical protein
MTGSAFTSQYHTMVGRTRAVARSSDELSGLPAAGRVSVGSLSQMGECSMSRDSETGRGDPRFRGGETDRFLVFSPTRCGSTTLGRLLNCHPQIRCLEEPFNPFNYEGRYLRQATNSVELDRVVEVIWTTHNGIKHTWAPDGWPFVGNPALNAAILLKPQQKVIFLRRRNLLRRLVSAHISNQTGVWGVFDRDDRKIVENFAFTPMDTVSVKAQLRADNQMLSHYRSLLVDNGTSFIDVVYEDLYCCVESPIDQIEILNGIFTFLGVKGIDDEGTLSRVGYLLNPEIMKLNSFHTYNTIPGIQEIDQECGSDETGWLFGQ